MALSNFKCKEDRILALLLTAMSPFLRGKRGHIGPCLRSTSFCGWYMLLGVSLSLLWHQRAVYDFVIASFYCRRES